MAYKLIKEFVDKLNGHQVTIITGPLSPLLLNVAWSKNPEYPIELLGINKGRESVEVVDEYFYHLCGETQFRNYFTKKVTKQELYDEYQDFALSVEQTYNELTQFDFSSADEKTILGILKRVIEVFEPVADTVYIETLNYEMALSVVGKKNRELLDSVWEQAIHPTFVSFEPRRLAHLIKLIKSSKDTSSLVRKVEYIFTDYHWTKSVPEIKKALDEIKQNLSHKEKELNEMLTKVEERRVEYQKWEKSLSPEQKFLTEYIQMVMEFRDIRKDPIAQSQALLIEIATELFKRAGIDPKYALATDMRELLKGVEYFKKNKGEIIRRTEEGNICYVHLDATVDVEVCDYKKAVEEFHALTSRHSDKIETFKGQIANKGNATGVVRIVLDPHNDKGFKHGDILVTSMTRPEFVPIMKKAGAVITDEGGITCHAAIVSRELNIPCVIGTKHATRMLKDGDRVEVDATKGIVTILK